ncbi:hypothetical protein O7598_07250 [Micromonospora sp. WMMC241]|uniref:hypothetical protein n=1 Tax=Micromonospora sp. WMMC241 TaxID=3015159 RepID=UPI0022B61E31|nr:hypothetical protein [Micromonospora sp. WMMC241]MCZ7436181.1 hypothetical protein [Micromonospora sp. WMMC241]
MAHFCAIAVPVAAFVVAHMLLVPHLLSWASRATHGSPTWMTTAGWATAAFAPAAALVFLLDGQRRERQLGNDPLNRPRVPHGHAIPERGSRHWIRRIPLILTLLVAAVFAPTRGSSGPVGWDSTPGGDAFRRGWGMAFTVSLLALIALLVVRILALLPGRGDRFLRVAGPLIATAAPALALLTLYTSTH